MSASPLRAALDSVIAEQGCSLGDLTVLAPKNEWTAFFPEDN